MIAFVINVYNDQHLALRLVKQIRKHFDQGAIVVSDGAPIDPELNDLALCRRFERVKDRTTGYWTQRYLQLALQTSAKTIIKLDPDTCVWRRFTPPDADWFGTLGDSGDYVRGGAMGLSRETAQKVVRSGLLHDRFPYVYYRYKKHRWPHEKESELPLSNQDHILRRVMGKLGIKPTPWPEVLIYGNCGRVPTPAGEAVTHPHPTLEVA